jgi:hypothetical protein
MTLSSIDLILEGLKRHRVDEAYGQYGKYTKLLTQYKSALIDAFNSEEFLSSSTGDKLHIKVDKAVDIVFLKAFGIRELYTICIKLDSIEVEDGFFLDWDAIGSLRKLNLISFDSEDEDGCVRMGGGERVPSSDIVQICKKAVNYFSSYDLFATRVKGTVYTIQFTAPAPQYTLVSLEKFTYNYMDSIIKSQKYGKIEYDPDTIEYFKHPTMLAVYFDIKAYYSDDDLKANDSRKVVKQRIGTGMKMDMKKSGIDVDIAVNHVF